MVVYRRLTLDIKKMIPNYQVNQILYSPNIELWFLFMVVSGMGTNVDPRRRRIPIKSFG
jgi:hypothetical protein